MDDTPLFELRDVHVHFRMRSKTIHALQGISLKGYPGQTLGIVGESGCGKSTLAKVLLGLNPHDAGVIVRPSSQMVFQDPDASLNPRMTIYNHIREAVLARNRVPEDAIKARVLELFDMVQIPEQFGEKYPYQLSGGQKQRVSIARALSVLPKLLILDEPLASLDVSISAQVIQLLKTLQRDQALSYLFITHDLASLRSLAHTVAVLYLGCLVELASCDALYAKPLHPYTQGLLSSILQPDPERERTRSKIVVPGELPSIINPPKGCVFHTRCPFATETCRNKRPVLKEHSPGQFVACHLY